MLARPHILVIDDDKSVLDLIADMLDPYYEVQVISDPFAALSSLEKEEYDLLILDLGIPELDGVEIIRQIRSRPRLQNLPVIVMSAYTGIARRVSDLHVQAIIHKPFHLEHFLKTLKRILEQRSPRGAHTSA